VAKTKQWLAEQQQEQPFFLYFSSQDIHVPRAPHPRFKGKSQLGYRGDAMVQFDWATGEILFALDKLGFTDNTIVIWSSDNGPVYDDGYVDGTTVLTSTEEVDRGHDGSGPYRGGKYQIFEGGTRVPLLVRWPGHVEVGESHALVNQIDFLASFAALLEVPVAKDQAIDSRDSLAALLGKDATGLPFMIEEAGTLAVRKGNWKYVAARGKKGEAQLFDLVEDIGEQHNVAGEHPERVAELAQLLEQLMASAHGVRGHG